MSSNFPAIQAPIKPYSASRSLGILVVVVFISKGISWGTMGMSLLISVNVGIVFIEFIVGTVFSNSRRVRRAFPQGKLS